MKRLIMISCAPVAFMANMYPAAGGFDYTLLSFGVHEEQKKNRLQEHESWSEQNADEVIIHSSHLCPSLGPEFEENVECDICAWSPSHYSQLPEPLTSRFQEAREHLISVQKDALGALFTLVIQSPRDAALFESNPLDQNTWILSSKFYYSKKSSGECLELCSVYDVLSVREQVALTTYNSALLRFHRAKKQLKIADEFRKKNPIIVDEEGCVRLVIENEGVLFWFDREGCMHVADAASIYL